MLLTLLVGPMVAVPAPDLAPLLESANVTHSDEGKSGFVAVPVLPTLRLSRTGLGVVWAVGTGEGFIRTNEPTSFEVLLGRRWPSVELWAGFSRGMSARVDGRLTEHEWLSFDLSAKPWGDKVEGTSGYDWWMASLTLSHRWSSFAPL